MRLACSTCHNEVTAYSQSNLFLIEAMTNCQLRGNTSYGAQPQPWLSSERSRARERCLCFQASSRQPICPYLHATRPVGQAPSLRHSRAEYIKTRPSNTLITYASYGNELSWTVEDCHCLWQLIIWPIDQNCSAHHRAPCPLHLLDHHSHCLSRWEVGGVFECA